MTPDKLRVEFEVELFKIFIRNQTKSKSFKNNKDL